MKWNAIKKYGWDNIEHIVLYEGLTDEEATEIEINLIEQYKSTDKEHGYNISRGGDLWMKGVRHSKEHNQKISDSHKKRVCSYSRDGRLVATYESIMDAAESVKGSFRVISSCCNGTKKSGYGHIWRFENDAFDKYETENKKGGVKGNPVIVFNLEGEILGSFLTAKAASKATGIREDVIGWICKGMKEEKNGLVFRYADEKMENDS